MKKEQGRKKQLETSPTEEQSKETMSSEQLEMLQYRKEQIEHQKAVDKKFGANNPYCGMSYSQLREIYRGLKTHTK